MATNVSDLVEACATVLLARTRHLELVRVPESPLDVLAQHLVSMGCTDYWSRTDALALIRAAYPFRNLDSIEFNDVLDYLAGGGASLRRQYTEVFGKIELDEEGFRTREGRVRREFLQNVGVIPNVGQLKVRAKTRVLGSVEESFIRQIHIGDVFMMSGRPVRLDKVTQMEAWVTPAPGALPTVPRWNAAKMPLSNRVAEEIVDFRGALREQITSHPEESLSAWIADRLDCGKANAEIVCKMHVAQHAISEIPTVDFLLVEELLETVSPKEKPEKKTAVARHYFFHSLIGRAANDALARVVTYRLSKLRGGNAVATPHDYGFVLTLTPQQHFTAEELPKLLDIVGFEDELHASLNQSEMLKYHFRNAAQTGLMVYRNYFDQQKSVKKLQWSSEVIFNVLQQHEPDHILLREARRDMLRVFLDIEGALTFLAAQSRKPLRLHKVERVPPLSFAMYATKIKEALLVEDPYETMERLYNRWWNEIEHGSDTAAD
jgi:ATP-dependent Lhr-like helicase